MLDAKARTGLDAITEVASGGKAWITRFPADGIGRGTSTYDGVSLACGITEYLHDRVGCRTLFATHYYPGPN